MPRREGDTAAAIVEVATALFAERGFSGTGVAEISRKLGITNAALYYHFDSKQALLHATLKDALNSHLDELERIVRTDEGATAKLRDALDNHLDLIFHRPAVIRVFLRERRFLEPDLATDYQRQVKRYEELIDQLIATHLLSVGATDSDPRLMRLGVLGMLNWITEWYRPDGQASEAEVRSHMIGAILDRLLMPARPHLSRGYSDLAPPTVAGSGRFSGPVDD